MRRWSGLPRTSGGSSVRQLSAAHQTVCLTVYKAIVRPDH
jgi:hypothetical protein